MSQTADVPKGATLFSLPREIRDQIYEFALGDLVSNALHIRKFDSDPHWKVCYNPNARVPGILLTSKLVHSEAKDCLYKSGNPPRIVIHHWYMALHAKAQLPEVIGTRFAFCVRDLESILPILETVQELNLEIKAPGEEAYCLLLVKWIRSVLNHRKTPLRTATIGVHNGDDVVIEAGKIRALSRPRDQIWFLERARRDDAQGPPKGRPVCRDRQITESLDSMPPSMAWQELINGESHYYTGTMIDSNQITVHPKQT